MSGEKFKEGLARSEQGKSSADPVLDLSLPTSAEKAERADGFKAGETAKATADATVEAQEKASKEDK